MRELVIAVDVGSSSARAGVFDVRGLLLTHADASFATGHPQTDQAEHSSDEIWTAECDAVRGAITADTSLPVKGIAFDATCSLVTLDRAGRAVTASVTGEDRWNVIMWADHRAAAEADEITASRHRELDAAVDDVGRCRRLDHAIAAAIGVFRGGGSCGTSSTSRQTARTRPRQSGYYPNPRSRPDSQAQ
jgi:ribulose kinase